MELVAGAPARHLRFQNELLPIFMSVTNEHARQICFQSGISSRRALLAEAVTRITDGHVPDQVYEEVRPHFTDKELADLALAVATINAWNRLAIASAQFPEPTSPPRCMKWRRAA